MTETKRSVLKNILYFSAFLIFISIGFFGIGEKQGVAVLSGVMLSSIFVGSSAWIFDTFKDAENSVFIKAFFLSTVVRFVLVLIVFGILIVATKIDEFYFTVSFIISYLCQSVMEIIFINKIL